MCYVLPPVDAATWGCFEMPTGVVSLYGFPYVNIQYPHLGNTYPTPHLFTCSKFLTLSKSIDRRMWEYECPLRYMSFRIPLPPLDSSSCSSR